MKHFGHVLLIGLLFAMVLPASAAGEGEPLGRATDSTAAIIRVRGASAAEAAGVLDQFFNGSATAEKDRVVVFAIPLTNYLLVEATSADLQTIRRLLRT